MLLGQLSKRASYFVRTLADAKRTGHDIMRVFIAPTGSGLRTTLLRMRNE